MSTWKELKDNPHYKEIYDARLQIIRLIREWFWSQDFVEANTPAAIACADEEPHLNPIAVTFHNEVGVASNFYLQTSPEYAMKKLLGAGYNKIFQVCPCWRDYEESGQTHNVEFTMLEWYRRDSGYLDIMKDIEDLFKFTGEKMRSKFKIQKTGCEPASAKFKIDTGWERVSIRELFLKFVGVNLDDYLTDEKMRELVKSLGLKVDDSDDYNDLFYKIFLNKIETSLGKEQPTIVYDYPIQMAALARPCPSDPRYAERFEVYIDGLEIANAFGELTDSEAQKVRFEAEAKERIRLGKSAIPIDKELLDALKSIPTAAGIALGVDRMVMVLTGAKNINEVMFQSAIDRGIY